MASHRILIADSGSTKTEWCLMQDNADPVTIYSAGLNPFYHTSDSIAEEIASAVKPSIPTAEALFFYGAGCAGEDAIGRVRTALQVVYGNIPIEVASDLLGAARAICQHAAGVACILGTGANTCYFDGKRVADQIPPLGFILGDEASAGYFGRKILQGYFYREIPDDLLVWLEQHHDMARPAILDAVYKKPHFNQFVAGFTKLFAAFPEHPWVTATLKEGFNEFLRRHVAKYDIKPGTPVGFVGSVAYYNQPVLKAALSEMGFTAGSFLKTPMEGLMRFHG